MNNEYTAKTVEKAVQKALDELQLNEEQVDITVVSEGGLLKQAKVIVTPKLTDAQTVEEFLNNVLSKMNIGEYVASANNSEDGSIAVNISGDGDGAVIGYRGEVLDALQCLASLIISNKNGRYCRIVIDSENYRNKREKILQSLAKKLESKVRRTNRPVVLEPMNAYERRIIHSVLQDSKYVSTESDGTGNRRHVVVSPKINNDILNAPQRKTLNFVYRSDKKRRK